MIKIISPNDCEYPTIINRSKDDINKAREVARDWIYKFNKDGWEELEKYRTQFEKPESNQIVYGKDEFEDAWKRISQEFKNTLLKRKENTQVFFPLQKLHDKEATHGDASYVGERIVPHQQAGLYIPGGTATFPTVLQILAECASVAGVGKLICATPSNAINDEILATCFISNVDALISMGGVAGIYCLVNGLEGIGPSTVIAGPGNVYVTAAKLELYGEVDIDSPAGPSEAAFIVDETTDLNFLVRDILARCEHDKLSSSVVYTTSSQIADIVNKKLSVAVPSCQRLDIVKHSISLYSAIIVCVNNDEVIQEVNRYAPEHLQIMTNNFKDYITEINNCGSIFLGNSTPVAVGDYAGFTNHVLPSSGYSRSFSPVSVRTFQKSIQYEYLSPSDYEQCHLEIMKPLSIYEEFDQHEQSLDIRLNNI